MLELETLLTMISNAVSNANNAVELSALKNYLATGYGTDNLVNNSAVLDPITIKLKIHDKILEVPVIALINNSSMKLEQLDMKIKFRLHENDNKLMAECVNLTDEDNNISEMELHFRNVPQAESLARINDHFISKI